MAESAEQEEDHSEGGEVEKSAGGLVTGGVIGAGMGGGGLPSTLGGALAGQAIAGQIIDKETEADRGEGPADLRDTPGTHAGAGQTKPVDKLVGELLAEAKGEIEDEG